MVANQCSASYKEVQPTSSVITESCLFPVSTLCVWRDTLYVHVHCSYYHTSVFSLGYVLHQAPLGFDNALAVLGYFEPEVIVSDCNHSKSAKFWQFISMHHLNV